MNKKEEKLVRDAAFAIARYYSQCHSELIKRGLRQRKLIHSSKLNVKKSKV